MRLSHLNSFSCFRFPTHAMGSARGVLSRADRNRTARVSRLHGVR